MNLNESWLSQDIDVEFHRQALAQNGRTQIRNVLRSAVAEQIAECLRKDVPWGIASRVNQQSRVFQFAEWRAMPANERAALYRQSCLEAQDGFQFWYQTYMMVTAFKENRDPGLLLHTVLKWLNDQEFVGLGRVLSGHVDVRKADAQATCYLPGHFLSNHDDSSTPQGHQRRMAYVLSLTESWNADWGGLLHFTNPQGHVVDTLVPEFNTLNLFLTPQRHAVTCVAPFAKTPRLSVTGWFRAD